MTLTKFREILADDTISTTQFLHVHCCVEELFRRLLLIGLRLQDVPSKDAAAISESYYTNRRENHFKTIVGFCGLDHSKLMKFGSFNTLWALYLDFTTRHRNRLMHGVALSYSDEELLKTLIHVDKSLIREFEAFLKHENKPSFLDEPRKWNAKRVTEKADVNEICKTLLHGNMPKPPVYTKTKAAAMMKKIHKETKTGG